MNYKNSNKKRVQFLAGMALPFALTMASLQGCGQTTQDEIKIASVKDSYKKFGISNETLRKYQEIESILKQDQERIGNDVLLELYPTYDYKGNIVEGKEGKLAKVWNIALREKIANAINRRYRKDNGLEDYSKDEENLPKIVKPKDISMECIDQEKGIYLIKAKINGDYLEYSNSEGSERPISKEVAEEIEGYFNLLSTDLNHSDIIRDETFKNTKNKYLNSMETILERECECTKSGELKKGRRVGYYHFSIETELEDAEKNRD